MILHKLLKTGKPFNGLRGIGGDPDAPVATGTQEAK
jgi:hypothetical protein